MNEENTQQDNNTINNMTGYFPILNNLSVLNKI